MTPLREGIGCGVTISRSLARWLTHHPVNWRVQFRVQGRMLISLKSNNKDDLRGELWGKTRARKRTRNLPKFQVSHISFKIELNFSDALNLHIMFMILTTLVGRTFKILFNICGSLFYLFDFKRFVVQIFFSCTIQPNFLLTTVFIVCYCVSSSSSVVEP